MTIIILTTDKDDATILSELLEKKINILLMQLTPQMFLKKVLFLTFYFHCRRCIWFRNAMFIVYYFNDFELFYYIFISFKLRISNIFNWGFKNCLVPLLHSRLDEVQSMLIRTSLVFFFLVRNMLFIMYLVCSLFCMLVDW